MRWIHALVLAALLAPIGAAAGCATAPTHVLSEGAAAPALKRVAHDGTRVDLAAGTGKTTLVYFYPKDATPGCTKEACAFRDVWQRFEDAGVLVVGVSADDNESHREFAQEHQLPFPLIDDNDHAWSNAFGVKTTLGMASRDSFLIAPDGTIAKVYRGVDPGIHAEQVLKDAESL